MVGGVAAQALIGYGFKLEAEMIITISATVIAYLAQRGYIEKANIESYYNFEEGFRVGKEAAEQLAAKKAAK
jgi:hypothetical protein